MTIVAFDVSKNELVGVRVNRLATVKDEYSFPNNSAAINTFLDGLTLHHRRLLIGSEATAEYHRPLALACIERSIPFKLINPIVTKQFTRVTVRKQKTDWSDALIIAKAMLQNAGTTVSKETFSPAKTLNRTAERMGQICGIFLRMERHLHETGCENVLHNELAELRKHTEARMKVLQKAARESCDPDVLTLLRSIPGIGPVLATAFVSELTPIKRFTNSKAIVAYAGLDPKIKQSGISLKRNTRLTKRGSQTLRRAAFIAASIAQRIDPDLKRYYLKKRAEGKRYREATIANARHILYRVYAVWKRGTPYVKKSSPQMTI